MRELQTNPITVRASAALTASYVGTVVPIGSENQLTLLVAYTMGATESSNSVEIKLEFSDDNSTWYQETQSSLSGGTDTLVLLEHSFAATQSAGTYDYFHFTTPINAKYVKVSVKETGKASNFGTCAIKGILSYV